MGRGGSAASATPSSSSPRPAAFPVTTPEPLVLVTPPRCLTANRTQQGVLLSWLPPANHSFPIDRYILEFRVGERWETLDDGIPGTELDFFARDLSQVRSLVFAGSDRELLLESLGAQVSGGCLHTATPALLLSQGCCQGLGKVCKFRASPEENKLGTSAFSEVVTVNTLGEAGPGHSWRSWDGADVSCPLYAGTLLSAFYDRH